MNYLLVGTEVFNLQKRKEEIISELIDNEINLSVYRGKDWIMSELISDCLTLPFLAEHKVVLVENPGFLSANRDDPDAEKLKTYLQKSNETTTLIIYCDQAVDRSKAIFKDLLRLMKYETFDSLSKDDFEHYVSRDLRNNKITMDNAARKELLSRLPNDISNWKQELEKLCVYPGLIDVEVIRQLVCRPIEEDVFQLSNAVTSKNLSKAIQIYRDLLVNNRNDVKSLIGLLAYQFRFMCQLKILSEQGLTLTEIAQRYSYNEYRVKIGLRNSQGFSSDYLLSLLNDLSALDQNIINGRVEAKLGLELFIMEACR